CARCRPRAPHRSSAGCSRRSTPGSARPPSTRSVPATSWSTAMGSPRGSSAWTPRSNGPRARRSPNATSTGATKGSCASRSDSREAWESFRIEPVDYAGSGDKLVVIVDLWGRGRGSGAEVEARAAHVWEFREGKAVRSEIYGDPEKALRDVEAR